MLQLQSLLKHAHDTLPFWRARLAAANFQPAVTPSTEWLSTLPVLTRHEVQTLGDALACDKLPAQHGQVVQGMTSGSTGRPITFYGSELTQLFWRAFTLRDHLWQRRDFSTKLAAIRTGVEQLVTAGWGGATDSVYRTGPLATLNISTDIDAQLEWLREEDPDYLLSFSSNLRALAVRALELGIRLPKLREVRTFGEALPEDLRALCRRAWNVKLVDIYSAQEVGYIALQCPGHDHYHVQSENIIVEILDEHGTACAPGQIGRVVVSTLHNFAMPLIRYDIGDYAESGEPCACGRGLPVIRRILGRRRNLLILPDGRQHWPSYPSDQWAHIAPVRQLQMIQRTREDILLRIVAPRPLTPQESDGLISALQASLGHPFVMQIERVAAIPRAPNFKYEDFISEVVDKRV